MQEKQDIEGAIEQYRLALKLKPDYATAHYNLGVALMAKSHPKEAAPEFREYLRLVPDTPGNRAGIERAKTILKVLEQFEDKKNGAH